MKQNVVKKVIRIMAAIMMAAVVFAGCGEEKDTQDSGTNSTSAVTDAAQTNDTDSSNLSDSDMQTDSDTQEIQEQTAVTELTVRFGDQGEPFTLHLLDNETAAAIVRHVGTSDWRLPIYERDDDVNYDVLQYYDIPSRYEIPANAETVTEAKTGDVFYSDPNRIVLFYHDAEISEEYTKIGTFDVTDEFIAAVENNPVLEGWGNKIIQISQP